MAYCCVFIACGEQRDRHSFPTRRSSDLAEALRVKVGGKSIAGLCDETIESLRSFFKKLPLTPRQKESFADVFRQIDRRLDYLQDRKSTRLNSSHRCISYAVFCLKKKKTR